MEQPLANYIIVITLAATNLTVAKYSVKNFRKRFIFESIIKKNPLK